MNLLGGKQQREAAAAVDVFHADGALVGADNSGDNAQAKPGPAVAQGTRRLLLQPLGPGTAGTTTRSATILTGRAALSGQPAGPPPGGVLLPAGLEDMRQVFFGDPAAAVRDRDDGPVAFPADLHRDAGAGRAVDNRVEHDIPDGASHRGAVGEGQAFPPAAAVERYAVLFGQRGEVGDGVTGEVVQIQRLGLAAASFRRGSGTVPGGR